MDRAEKIGLGTAVGGHLVLLALLSLGLLLSANNLPSSRGISVSLVGEEADISTAPDATQEDTAPAPSADELSPPDEPPPAPETVTLAKQTAEPQTRSKQLTEPRPVTNKQSKQTIPPRSQPQRPTQTAQQSKPGSGRKAGGFTLPDETIRGKGKSNETGKAEGQKASKTAAQYRSEANTSIGSEVKPFIPSCAPPTSDNSSLEVFVALRIDQSARLISASIYDVKGETPSNIAQVPKMKECVLQSLRQASPYKLDLEGYDAWKDHRVRLKVNFK